MKKFGERFKTYEPLEVDPDSVLIDLESLDMPESKKFAKAFGRSKSELEAELCNPVIGIASAANVYKISADQKDLDDFIKKTLTWYEYYLVELGLNVMVGRETKIPELLFKVVLKGDINESNVIAHDIAPKDEIKYTQLLSGTVKINLGIDTFLKFVPVPLGEEISGLLNIDINPWEFKWGITKYMIDSCGEKDSTIYWKIYETDTVQGFNPVMIIRAKKDVKTISAHTRCVYKMKAGWIPTTPEIKSKEKEIAIWPV
jgi:hypothetical protein